MSAEYMHIGIPITNRKPNMTYNEGAKFWVSNVDDYDYKIEYLKFEEGTPFPEEIHRNPHVAYKAIQEGAHGVDMGRNIFQSDCPAGMAQAIGKVVHEGYTPQQAYEVYETVKHA